MISAVALIPARGGSKRVLKKNTRLLAGAPLITYTINTAKLSGIFDQIIVSTDDEATAEIAIKYGATVPELRPSKFATDSSPDIDWVSYAAENWLSNSEVNLVILRPTSPLRKPQTIKNAHEIFCQNAWADSLRAMQPVAEHPGKMWRIGEGEEATPFMDQLNRPVPTHSSPTNTLEEVWVQNASLEIVKSSTITGKKTLAGDRVLKYEMPGLEGYDINSEKDWAYLEFLIKSNPTLLSAADLRN